VYCEEEEVVASADLYPLIKTLVSASAELRNRHMDWMQALFWIESLQYSILHVRDSEISAMVLLQLLL
jgi:hypothetical protein